MEIIDVWNIRIAEVTRKKDSDKKKEKPMTVDVETSTTEDPSESQENRNSIGERDQTILSKKVKSLDSSDSM